MVEVDFLLVGGGVAAVTAAQTLRDEGADGSILMLCAEAQYPYNRPPLTKEIAAGDGQRKQHLLAPPEYYRENRITIRLGSAAHAVDCSSHTVVDQSGGAFRYGKLLIATGARPRRLSVPGADLGGVFTFRYAMDATALYRWVTANPGPVAIVGTSFIAMELATSLSRMGLNVTLIDKAESAFPKIQSPTLSRYFFELCEAHGIGIFLGETIARFGGTGRVSALQTAAGRTLPCSTIILAIGAEPQTDFLEHSDLRIDDGVLVDEFLQASAPDVFAAGDVAAYLDRYGKRQRAEHWENARRQGRIAAKNMLGQRVPYSDVRHYFCSFFDLSFTFLGTSEEADTRIGRGRLEDKSFAEFYIRNDRVIGFFSTGRPPAETRVTETLIRDHVDVRAAAAQLADPAASIERLARETILILQGGGAFGAFECGVVRAMSEARIAPSIVSGVSVGAVNGAIIAGNPTRPAAALEAFWNDISVCVPSTIPAQAGNFFAVGSAMTWGIPGFFRPRWLAPGVGGEFWPCQWTSLYDPTPIKTLLCKYVDFAKLPRSPVRLIVAAVDVDLGELVFFDSRVDKLTPDHILASCSLPPIFPWTTIDGHHYWDGGIISNSPLEHVLRQSDAANRQVIVVDLFPGKRPLPTNLAEVLTRRDEITYGERIRSEGHIHELVHDFQALVAEIMVEVGVDAAARLRQRPRYVHLMGQGSTTSITRIVRDGSDQESMAAGYDFSTQAIARHRREGYLTAQRLLASLIHAETSATLAAPAPAIPVLRHGQEIR